MTKWMLKQSSANMDELTRQIGDPVLARILAVRGYRDPEAAADFLLRGRKPMASPFLFADMQTAVEALADAIDAGCSIVVYGDYDADGIMSTVILLRTLRTLGANVSYYIPDRSTEGYGMNEQAIYKLVEQGVDVIIACDNGISAVDQVELANELGMTVVILDHHDVIQDPMLGQILPPAEAVVDAKRLDCTYPFKGYCAAGLCYRFSEALFSYVGNDWLALKRELLPFAAFATVTDIVELTGENRVLVRYGLPLIGKSTNPGLTALRKATGLDSRPINAYHVGFILGPCINASGRMERADLAVEMLMTEDSEIAEALAAKLLEYNTDRRARTDEGTDYVLRLISEKKLDHDRIIVVHAPLAEESVAGIIAGRVKEKYLRPVIVLVGRGEVVRGSGRSVEAYNLYEGLSACRDLFVNFGGHPMAAGLTISVSDIDQLRERVNSACLLSIEELEPVCRIDCQLLPAAADLALAQKLSALEPFGKDNPAPLFVSSALRLERLQELGKDKCFLRWQMRQPNGRTVEFVDFECAERLKNYLNSLDTALQQQLLNGKLTNGPVFDVVYSLTVNEFNGRESARLLVEDFRPSKQQ